MIDIKAGKLEFVVILVKYRTSYFRRNPKAEDCIKKEIKTILGV